MEIKNQHQRNIANLAFSLLFAGLVGAQLVTLWQLPTPPSLELTEFVLLSLAVFRLTRLFVYDGVTSWLRDLFIDVSEKRGTLIRVKKQTGLQRTVSDIFSCPWCFSMWGGSVFIWAYIMFPSVMLYAALVLAISAVATMLQLSANLLGWKAEYQKKMTEKL